MAKTTAEVRAVHLIPNDPPACPESIEAVLEADWIVLGPGSWFTSVIPHLLVPELADAIHATSARRLLTLNLEPADETDGFSAARHVELLAEHAPDLRLDAVLADQRFAADDPHLADLGDVARRRAGRRRPRPPATARPATTRCGWRRRTPRSWASEPSHPYGTDPAGECVRTIPAGPADPPSPEPHSGEPGHARGMMHGWR